MHGNTVTPVAPPPGSDPGGFTLIEVLITLSILATGLLAVASMQITALHVGFSAGGVTEGTTWAQDRLEQLLALDYAHADLEDTDATVGTATTHTDASPPPGTTITWSVDVDNPTTDMKLITVVTTWTDRTRSKSTTLTCLKSRL